MSNAATFELSKVEAARLDRALTQSISIENRSAVETVKYLMIRIMMAGRSRTPKGKKFREIIENPAWGKGSRLKRYAIIKRLQPSGYKYIYTDTKAKSKNPQAIIKRQGLAKSAWGWGLKLLGENANTGNQNGKHTKVQKILTALNPAIILNIALTYIDKIAPGIVATSINSAVNYVLKRQEQKLEKQLRSQFKS